MSARERHGIAECCGEDTDQGGCVFDGHPERRAARLALPQTDDDDTSLVVPGDLHLSAVVSRIDERMSSAAGSRRRRHG